MSKSIPRATIRSRVCTILLLIGLCAPAYAQQGETSAVPVGTTYAERRAIDKALDLSAASRRSAASRCAPASPAISSGPVQGGRARQGGRRRSTGSSRGLFEAAVKQAEGALERSKAALHPRGDPVRSGRRTCSTGIPAPSSPATRRGPRWSRRGANVTVDEANLQTARINLGYTEITAPIAGRIGRTSVTKGNVVGPGERRADHDRQPGPDVRHLPGEPARVPALAAERASAADRQQGQGPDPLSGRLDLRPGRPDRLRRCQRRPRHRHGAWCAPTMPNPDGRADRRPAGAGRSRGRQPGAEGRGAAGRADRRPGGRLRLRRRGRQGRDPAHQAGRRAAGPDRDRRGGLSGGEQVIVEGLQRGAARHRRCGQARPAAGQAGARADVLRRSSSTGRGSRSSSRSSRRSPARWRC